MPDAVLLIEDDPSVRHMVGEFLSLLIDTSALEVKTAGTLAESREILEGYDVKLIFTDVNLGHGIDALTLINELHEQGTRPYVIASSSVSGLKKTEAYLASGVVDAFLAKPFKLNQLQACLKESNAVALR